MRIPFCTFFCFLFLFTSEICADGILSPAGTIKSPDNKDFFQHSAISDKFNETWSYQLVFDNGTKAFINYATLYVPGSGRKIGCDLSFSNFKGKNPSVGRQYPPERLKENKSLSKISIKDEYFMEGLPGKGHRVYFTANKGGQFFVDVSFESALESKVKGNGVWTINGEKYAQYIHIPYGRITGKIAYNGDTLTVKGYGYMEHTWQTVQATDLAIRSFNFSTASAKTVYAGRIGITPNGEPWGHIIYSNDGKTTLLTPKTISDNGTVYSGKEFPKGRIQIHWIELQAPLSFDVSKPQQKFSILNNFDGWFAKQATKLMMGGEVFFYRGRSMDSQNNTIDWSFTGF
jgi:hypothetical protein